MKTSFALSALLLGLTFAAGAATNVVFSDNFESGTLANWTTTGTSPLDPSTTQNAVPPTPAGQWSAFM